MEIRKLVLTDTDWRARLTPEQYKVMRQKGTEPAFANLYWDCKEQGIYYCAACGLPLFSSEAKYDSGTGWPSFWEPISPQNIYVISDYSLSTKRLEVLCSKCDSHLGHVFPDGPPPAGKRYCMNSVSLAFERVPLK